MIFGESAGGGSVSLHLLMKKSWPLYHKAVLESPGPWRYPSLTTANSLCQGIVDTIPACNTSSPSQLLSCLRGLSADQVLNAWNEVFLEYGGCTNPCIDKQQLMDAPGKLFTEGIYRLTPTILIVLYTRTTESEGPIADRKQPWRRKPIDLHSSLSNLQYYESDSHRERIQSPYGDCCTRTVPADCVRMV